ncbi:MAG: hypothetical protein L3J74_08035 [Bacteroidales bacterium]|nr:hypothetical protein [Bacteroidales bacterium]
MEIILSAAGLISIIALIFWVFAIPFVYPKYFSNTVTELVPKTYLFLFWSFFLFYFAMGVVLIHKGLTGFGLVLILFLTLGYGFIQYLKSRKILTYGVFSFVLEVAYGSIHQIILYLFIAGMLLYGIYLFYNQSIIYGAIIGYFTIIQISTSILGLIWYRKQKENTEFNNEFEFEKTTSNSENISLKQVLNDFEKNISVNFYHLINEIDSLLSILVEFVYVDYIPEKLKTGTAVQIISVINDYILTESTIPNEEKTIIKNLIEKRKELYRWKNDFNSAVFIHSNILPDHKKLQTNKKKKTTNKPPKSAGK